MDVSAAIERLRALEAKATPGPWEWWTSNSWRRLCAAPYRSVLVPTVEHDGHPDCSISEDDMALIVAARNALLPLLRVAAAAEEAMDTYRDYSYDESFLMCMASTLESDLKPALAALPSALEDGEGAVSP